MADSAQFRHQSAMLSFIKLSRGYVQKKIVSPVLLWITIEPPHKLKRKAFKAKKEAVTTALKEYIAHKKQLEVLDLFGSIEFDKNFDYKKARKR